MPDERDAFVAVSIPRVDFPPPPPKMEAERPFDIHSMDGIHTALYAQIAEPFYTYVRVPWTFDIRKEVKPAFRV